MKKILAILAMMLMCVGVNAQDVTYSQELVKKAESGDAQAMYDLGECYADGLGVTNDFSQATYWWKKAAENGNPFAMCNLGLYYNSCKDFSQAFYWYKKSSENGNAFAMILLGSLYSDGLGVTQDLSKAFYWWKVSASKGNIEAMNILGDCYFCGKYGEVDFFQAAYWWNMAAKRDHPRAMGNLGFCYENGLGIAKDYSKAAYWYKKGAENGDSNSMYRIGLCYFDGSGISRNVSQGVYWYKKASEKGNADAMNKLGNCYFTGIGVDLDWSQTVYWYNMAAEGGNSEAMNSLGSCYYDGVGVTKDLSKAFYWFKKAAENDDINGMNNIGLCYIKGEGVAKDAFQAIYWWMKAAEMGDANSLRNLGVCYANGEGVNKDVVKAETLRIAREEAEEGNKERAIQLFYKVFPNMAKKEEPNNTEEPFMAASDVDMNIPHNAVKDANTFALIIANENYRQESNVIFALNDGNMFGVYCQEVLGLPKENIRLLKDATLNEIRGGVNWLKKVADAYKGDANLIFYYAGHGVPDEKTKDAYLLPVDGYGNDLVTAYKIDDLYANLSSCPSKQTLVFLDACFSGKQRSGDDMASTRAVGISVKRSAPKGNMIVFSAAQGDETAYPYEDKQHGMFTYYLLKKLQLSKGDVSLGDLGSYIKENVLRKSVIINTKSQTPTVSPAPGLTNWREIRLR